MEQAEQATDSDPCVWSGYYPPMSAEELERLAILKNTPEHKQYVQDWHYRLYKMQDKNFRGY